MSYFTSRIIAIILFLVHTGAERVDLVQNEGLCPKPTPAQGFDPGKLVGRWLDAASTYEPTKKAENKRRRCVENIIQLDPSDGGLFINTTYMDKMGDVFSLLKKFVPVVGNSGRFTTQIFSDMGWQDHIWIATFVHVDNDSFVEFGCKLTGENQRKEFHRLRTRHVPVAAAIIEKFLVVSLANGDDSPIFQYDHDDCTFELADMVSEK